MLDREGRLVEGRSPSCRRSRSSSRRAQGGENAKAAAEIAYNIIRPQPRGAAPRHPAGRGFFPREQADQLHDELAYDQRLQPMQDGSNQRQEALRQAQLPQIEAEMATLRESLAVTRSKLDSLILKAPGRGQAERERPAGRPDPRSPATGSGRWFRAAGSRPRPTSTNTTSAAWRSGEAADITVEGRRYPMVVTRVDPQVRDATFQVELAFKGASADRSAGGRGAGGQARRRR